MSLSKSRFGSLAQAVKDRTAGEGDQVAPAPAPMGAGVHKPIAALGVVAEGLRDRIKRLETELAQANTKNTGLERDLAHARTATANAGEAIAEFLFLDPTVV